MYTHTLVEFCILQIYTEFKMRKTGYLDSVKKGKWKSVSFMTSHFPLLFTLSFYDRLHPLTLNCQFECLEALVLRQEKGLIK